MKQKRWILLVAAAAVLLAAAGGGYYAWYQNAHVFVEDAVYEKDAEVLDLRGSGISVEHYEALREQMPDCEITWDVPFQGGFYPNDTTEITVTSLTEEDIVLLEYLPRLTAVHAENCRDYPQLMALQQRRPECEVSYQVVLNGENYDKYTTDLTFTQADPEELLELLQYLPELETVHFVQPAMAAEKLLQLRESYPDVTITWEKDVFGTTYSDDVTEFDFSGMALEGVEEVEELMTYFPSLEKLILCNCGIDNETLAAYRDRARENYKVVWSVMLGYIEVRTDSTSFMYKKYQDCAIPDNKLVDLVYCEDMICIDLGHSDNKNLDWLYGMPHLQFLVVADSSVSDLTAIGSLKELIYLELFKCPAITDYSPLVGCTALEDVNVAYTNGDAAVFADMPWLKNLWVNCCNVKSETRALLTESLPDTHIEFDNGWHLGGGWRALDNYYVMRDILEMPYYAWGAENKN